MKCHLVVLVHGLQGNRGHMRHLENKFNDRNVLETGHEEFIVFNMTTNDDEGSLTRNWARTGDGIAAGGMYTQ